MWLRVIVGFRFTIIIIAVPSYDFIERHFPRMKAAKKVADQSDRHPAPVPAFRNSPQ